MTPRPRTLPLSLAVAAVAVGAALAAPGCVKTIPRPDGARCEGQTPADGELCDGGTCLAFDDNVQGLPGMCTRPCTDSSACEDGGVCLGPFADGGYYCLKACTSNFDCYDGAACVSGAVTPFCWVTPV